jgi:hypothetical protein
MQRLLALSFVAGLSVHANAQNAPCAGMPPLATGAPMTPRLQVVRSGVAKVRFVKGVETGLSCPSAAAICAGKAFVMPGDALIVTATSGDYVCATFTDRAPKAVFTSGWLPRAALTAAVAPTKARADWIGVWRSGAEREIRVKPAAHDRIIVAGEATYGARDPGRVKRGAVNSGEIEAVVAIHDGVAGFTMDGETTKPVDADLGEGNDACRVRLWRLGPYLVAGDNMLCGGMNVTFTGVYRRMKDN